MEEVKKIEKKEELKALKSAGLKWAVLKCLYKNLRQTGLKVSQTVPRNLEVARCIIETSCRKLDDAENLLNQTENILIEKTGQAPDTYYWRNQIEKAEKGELTREEALKIPFMKDIIAKYEFLSYCF